GGHRATLAGEADRRGVAELAAVGGIDGHEIALRWHVQLHQRGNARTEQAANGAGADRAVRGGRAGCEAMADVVDEAGHLQLDVVGPLCGEERGALQLMVEHRQRVAVVTGGVVEAVASREQLPQIGEVHPCCFARMMLSALPARNHSICSELNECVQLKSITVPSGFVMRHATGWSGASDARPSTEMRSSSPIRS